MIIPNQKYIIKWGEETAWLAGQSVAAYLIEFAATTPSNVVHEWKYYAIALGIGSWRIAAAIVRNRLHDLTHAA